MSKGKGVGNAKVADTEFVKGELTMRNNPFEQFRFVDRTVCKAPTERFKFVVGTGNRQPVDLQKNQHGEYANAFVSVKTAAWGNKLAMQRYYFISTDTFYTGHFANALNAARCSLSISSPAAITSPSLGNVI
jgi:hypothetical protein